MAKLYSYSSDMKELCEDKTIYVSNIKGSDSLTVVEY